MLLSWSEKRRKVTVAKPVKKREAVNQTNTRKSQSILFDWLLLNIRLSNNDALDHFLGDLFRNKETTTT